MSCERASLNKVASSENSDNGTDEKVYEFSDEVQSSPLTYYNEWRNSHQNITQPVFNYEAPSCSRDFQNTINFSREDALSESDTSDQFSLEYKDYSNQDGDYEPSDYDSLSKHNESSDQNEDDENHCNITELSLESANKKKKRNDSSDEDEDQSMILKSNLESANKTKMGVNILSDILIRPAVEVSRRRNRVWDKRDRCIYCNKDVTNFSRHLFRNHNKEESVVRILNIKKGSKERANCIDMLRKQGNLSVYPENKIRPVQRPPSDSVNLREHYLPCKYCKGLYKKNSLGRHAKRCYFNNEAQNTNIRHTSEGQTLLAFTESRKNFLCRLRLKTEVFSTMRADRISFNAKNDSIACQYGEDYLNKHKRPHIKNLVGNKLREVGRLLVTLQDVYQINTLLEALKPDNYEKVVSAVRIISGYDDTTKTFRAPSLALHFKTILLSVCSAAQFLLFKKDPVLPVTDYDDQLKSLSQFREMIDSRWKFAMGSLALKDLNEKCSLKPKKIPITNDIIMFKKHCHAIATKAMAILKDNPDSVDSFKKLSEVTLILTILLNRKRVGDVQYLKLDTYMLPSNSGNEEECLNLLTETERELSKNFKRLVTIGKGSKPVAILFPRDIQGFIEILLKVRTTTTIVPADNPFLFALPGNSSKWLDGSSILRKYAVSCGAVFPETLTSSRLRKQIATVLQILNLSEIELEQIATFMGHTKATHEKFYRMPQELYQTSKIAKLLLLLEKGITKEDEGKTLDEIDTAISVQFDELNLIEETNEDRNEYELEIEENINEPIIQTKNTAHRGIWTNIQKKKMEFFFKTHIMNKISPKKHECLEFKQKHIKLFEHKSWIQIKVFVYNTYRNAR